MLFFKTKKGHKVLNFLFSFFAAVVILGALFKIRHWPAADLMITLGLLSEVVVFMVMAFLVPPPEEYYWERFFPNITEHPDLERERTGRFEMTPIGNIGNGVSKGNPAMAKLDEMLEQAGINEHSLSTLNENFQRFGTTVEGIRDVSQAVNATADFTLKTQEASSAMVTMTQAYGNAARSLDSFNSASEDAKTFQVQLQSMTQNLSSLNAMYELELKDTSSHLKAMNNFYGNLVQASETMSNSIEDANNTQVQIAMLAKNLGNLNSVYGNMLNAMQGR